MKVLSRYGWKNVKGSSKSSPYPENLGSWLAYYVANTDRDASKDSCSNLYCPHNGKESDYRYILCMKHEMDIVGGHVYQADSDDKTQYIVPLCKTCNASNDELVLRPGTIAVSANQSQDVELAIIR